MLREAGIIKTEQTRNRQLQEVADVICEKVLANNYTQSLCLSLDYLRCQQDSEPYIDLAERLVNAGLLDRQGEFLPSRKELTARGQGYVRPELSILLAYSKMHLYQTLLESSLPEQEAAQAELATANQAASTAFLEENKAREGVVVTDLRLVKVS